MGEHLLDARFGLWHVQTALDSIGDVSITGPYTFVKTAGPAHLSLAEQGTHPRHRRGSRRVPDHA